MTERYYIENELNEDMIELIKHHLPNNHLDTIRLYENFNHETVLYYITDERGIRRLDAMISYFFFDFSYDSIVVMQRDNNFNRDMWKILKDTIKTRSKQLRIMSDPTNQALRRAVERLKGYWVEDEIIFE